MKTLIFRTENTVKIWIMELVESLTPPIKLIALSCRIWIFSTRNVVILVFNSCKMQLSDNLSTNNRSLSKPRIVQSFCSAVFTAPEILQTEIADGKMCATKITKEWVLISKPVY